MNIEPQSLIFMHTIASGAIVAHGTINLFLNTKLSGQTVKSLWLASFKSNDLLPPLDVSLEQEDRVYSFAYRSEEESLLLPRKLTLEQQHNFVSKLTTNLLQRYSYLELDKESLELEGKTEEIDLRDLLAYLALVQKESFAKQLQKRKENSELSRGLLEQKINHLGKQAGFSASRAYSATEKLSNAYYQALISLSKSYSFDVNKGLAAFKEELEPLEIMQNFQKLTGVRMRRVNLTPNFYKNTVSPILGFIKDEDRLKPVAIYLKAPGSYYLANNGEKCSIDASNAKSFAPFAFCFYESLKANITEPNGLLDFVFKGSANILSLIIFLVVVGSLLSFALPIATQYLVSNVIPSGNIEELVQLLYLLVILACCQIGLGVVPELILQFYSNQKFESFQAGLYDRILRLKTDYLNNWDKGDLANRIMSASHIQRIIFKVLAQQFLASAFALASVVMMLVYSPQMTLIAIGFVAVYLLLFLVGTAINYRVLIRSAEVRGRISGILNQIVGAIVKIKSANASFSMISRFMEDFGKGAKLSYKISRNASIQGIAALVLPTIISIVFFAFVGGLFGEYTLSLASFLAFMMAFQIFQIGVIGLSKGVGELLAIRPAFARIKPLLEAELENEEGRSDIEAFEGELALSHISFKYPSAAQQVLSDVSLAVKKGEFIAIVGPSGAGKSSLVKILLGFVRPNEGAVYYGNSDLSRLNYQSVRKNLGVILQNDRVFTGSIVDNILVGTTYTIEDAKLALEQADFLAEVEAMPMGLYTMISPDTISGGQQQRILIARALVGKPRLLILDESTSALDNLSQQKVSNNLSRLKVTRIVIAHRLSTIAQADRIYVLSEGKIAQIGSYEQLIAEEGIFRDLAKRQQG